MMLRSGPALTLAALLLAGCASQPHVHREPAPPPVVVVPTAGERAAARALEFVGTPYRYGGSGPDAFDCSGLVSYVFAELGLLLPRTSEAQFAVAQPVMPDRLAAGDLVFFRIPEAHIGIYVGDGRFVHAPASGRVVSTARLDEPWFRRAFVGGGRVVSSGPGVPPGPSSSAVQPAGAPAAPGVDLPATMSP